MRQRRSLTRCRMAACFAVAMIPGCADSGDDGDRLLVAAASDLALAMPDLVEAFARESGITVDVTLGSSGQIAHQIENGAPIDVFLSADRGSVERLRERGLMEPQSDAVYARGPLAVVTARGAELGLREVADLGRASARRVAIANPEHAPYGRAAKQVLEAAGLWDDLAPRIVIAENIRQAVQYVDSRAVDAAIGALALVRPDVHDWFAVPEHLHEPLDQTLAVIAGRTRRVEAAAFARFLLGPTGRDILARHNFILPAGPGGMDGPDRE